MHTGVCGQLLQYTPLFVQGNKKDSSEASSLRFNSIQDSKFQTNLNHGSQDLIGNIFHMTTQVFFFFFLIEMYE